MVKTAGNLLPLAAKISCPGVCLGCPLSIFARVPVPIRQQICCQFICLSEVCLVGVCHACAMKHSCPHGTVSGRGFAFTPGVVKGLKIKFHVDRNKLPSRRSYNIEVHSTKQGTWKNLNLTCPGAFVVPVPFSSISLSLSLCLCLSCRDFFRQYMLQTHANQSPVNKKESMFVSRQENANPELQSTSKTLL